MRPAHWIKNGFVLAPFLFTFRQPALATAARALVAFAAFCLASSAVYAFNDLLDRKHDRACPLKRHRPLASGALGTGAGVAAAAACAAGAAAIAVLLLPPAAAALLAGYAVLNVGYSLLLKRMVIIDVVALSTGFVIRVLAGGAAISAPVSAWMLLTTFFLALFLGFSKRQAEMRVARRGSARLVLSSYSRAFLATLIPISVGLTIVTYALSVIQPTVAARPGAETLLYTVPIVVYGLLRYLHLTLRGGAGADAADIVRHDPPLLVTVALWGGMVICLAVLRV